LFFLVFAVFRRWAQLGRALTVVCQTAWRPGIVRQPLWGGILTCFWDHHDEALFLTVWFQLARLTMQDG